MRAYRLAALCLAANVVWAGQSVRLAGGETRVAIPAGTPWTTIGSSPMRWELRIHNWTGNLTGYHTVIGPWSLWSNNPDLLYITPYGSNNFESVVNGLGAVRCCAGRTDVLIRLQRDIANNRYTMEACDTATGGNCSASSGTIGILASGTWVGRNALSLASEPVAFVRWYSSVVPFSGVSGGRIATPIPLTGKGDLGNWDFEGSLKDTSGHGLNLSGGAAYYTPTQTYPPSCSAGAQQTFRAGFRAALDGSGSQPLDEGVSLQYMWRQLSGPRMLEMTDRTTARAALTGLIFGSYLFRLTVTDGSGQSSSCEVKHGAVASDDNGVVITNNPTLDTVLGPLIRFGANPWPWYDDRHKADADIQISSMDTAYSAFWDVAAPGTINVTQKSANITGTGTSFTTTLCQGPESPTVPRSGAHIIAWYPTGNPVTPTGRYWVDIASCQSDTQATAKKTWNLTSAAGISYAGGDYTTNYGSWGSSGSTSPVNYYDNVAAYYSLYYRSGIDDYLIAARKLADRFWSSPNVDQGNCVVAQTGVCWPGRSMSLMGLTLRALDGRPDMWPGLYKLWNSYQYSLTYRDAKWIPGLWDVREVAYDLAFVAICGLTAPDSDFRAGCRRTLGSAISGFLTTEKQADGSYPQIWTVANSWDTKSSVTLTQGSTIVTGNGTSWNSSQFGADNAIWFYGTDPSVKPASNNAGDSVWYKLTFIDATHLTLDRAYAGTTGKHGWALHNTAQSPVGFGVQPFIEGILSAAFDLAAQALAGTDPANSALAHNYNVTTAKWIMNNGFHRPSKGMFYFAGSLGCTQLVQAFPTCVPSGSPRTYNAEVVRGVWAAYAHTKDPVLKDFGDILFNSMWAKPYTCPANSALCSPDGSYIKEMDDGGWDMTPKAPVGNKFFGMFFGFDNPAAWPAVRVGGLRLSGNRTSYVAFDLQSVPGAVMARVQATNPSGATTSAQCAASPCAVPIGAEPGGRLYSLEYLSAAGAVLAKTQAPVTQVQ